MPQGGYRNIDYLSYTGRVYMAKQELLDVKQLQLLAESTGASMPHSQNRHWERKGSAAIGDL